LDSKLGVGVVASVGARAVALATDVGFAEVCVGGYVDD